MQDLLRSTKEIYGSAEEFFTRLQVELRKEKTVFRAAYTFVHDPIISFRDRMQMTAQEIYQLSGYRFT